MTVDLRLALPAGTAWIAVSVFLAIPAVLPTAAVVSWALAVACVVVAILARRPGSRRAGGAGGGWRGWAAMAVVIATAAAMVLSSAAVRDQQRHPDWMTAAASSGRFVVATATTTETLQAGQDRFDATLESVTIGGRTTPVEVPVTVFGSAQSSPAQSPVPSPAAAKAAAVGLGSTITLSGTLADTDPGESSAYLFFSSSSAAPSVVSQPPWFLDWANALRAGFQDAAAALPGDGAGLLPGLAIGDTSAVSAELNSAMKTSSLSHLTAVSGANCAVLIGLIMIAGGALGVRRGLRVSASLAVLLGFVVLVTPQPSVLRAAVMAVLVLVALGSGRPARGIPVLALAVLVLLVTDPWLSRSYGFILSVLATGGLLVLARPLTTLLSRWMPVAVAAVIAIPLAAQLACQPVLILLNPSIPLYAVPANVLAEPAAPLATVLGLAACAILPLWPFLGDLIAAVAWVPSSWIAAVARFFSGLPGSSLPWLSGAAGAVLVALIVLLALVVLLRPDARWSRSRRIGTAALAVILVAYPSILAGDRIRQEISRPSDWEIAACDIGQGDAVLVRSGGMVALIDAGPEPARMSRCLDILGIGRIDLLVLTHYDLDHVGGAPALFGRVDRAIIGPAADANDTRLAGQLRHSGAEVDQVNLGDTGRLGELRWQVLWPPARLGGIQLGNDASVTLEFSGVGTCGNGCLSSLFLGDLGEEPQARMMAANRLLAAVDVVKVAHHGSADQNSRLYDKVRAAVGIIGVGKTNTYGHPTEALLAMLVHSGTMATRTDRDGMILISPRLDGTVSVWTEKNGAAKSDGARE
ncbi:MAG: ComEC/Rec2 family competence protein [Microbacteriaceae bacterium]|nr:ComEC/Rec2 family competence protein [Microbacteriaceae bacterium]